VYIICNIILDGISVSLYLNDTIIVVARPIYAASDIRRSRLFYAYII